MSLRILGLGLVVVSVGIFIAQLGPNQALASAATDVVLVADFTQPSELSQWSVVTDRLREGRETTGSTGQLLAVKGGAVFQGELFIQQGAGFSSIRRTGTWDASALKRLMVEGSGDGREYTFLLKDQAAAAGGYSYQARAQINAASMVTEIALDQLEPVRRGQPFPGAAPLDLSDLTEVGIQINDGVPGPFELRLNGFWFEN